MSGNNQPDIFKDMSISQIIKVLYDPKNSFSSEDLKKIIDKLSKEKVKKEKDEARKRREEEEKRREMEAREEEKRKEAHIKEVTSMDLFYKGVFGLLFYSLVRFLNFSGHTKNRNRKAQPIQIKKSPQKRVKRRKIMGFFSKLGAKTKKFAEATKRMNSNAFVGKLAVDSKGVAFTKVENEDWLGLCYLNMENGTGLVYGSTVDGQEDYTFKKEDVKEFKNVGPGHKESKKNGDNWITIESIRYDIALNDGRKILVDVLKEKEAYFLKNIS